MSQTYFALLTAIGEAKLANAVALGTQLQISRMAVGDGNGNLPAPIRTQTALVNERYRADLNSLITDPANTSQIIAELVIPETEGGYWLREMGLYDAAGDLIAVSNCPPSYKPQMAEGSGRTQVLRMVLIVSSTAAVQLKIDPSVVLATRAFVQTTVAALPGSAVPLMSGTATPGTSANLSRQDHRHPTDTSRAPVASPAFTGTPTAPTPATGDSSTRLATTAFVGGVFTSNRATASPLMAGTAAVGTSDKLAREDHRHPTDTTRAPLNSPAFTGTPTAPTPSDSEKSARLATTEFARRIVGDTAGGIAVPSVSVIDSATDLNAITEPGWFPALLGGAAGSRNPNHPDGQAALAIGNGVTNYYWVLVARYSGNLIQLALPYVSGVDNTFPGLKFRLLGGGTWTGWRSMLHSESLKEASQAEAEAAAITGKWLSPLRALQLLRAAAATATEALRGVLRIATQTEVDTGTADDLIVTPKKLFNGALIVSSTYMALKLPSWLGGWILQRGTITVSAESGGSSVVSVTLPLQYVSGYSVSAQFCYTGAILDNANIAQVRGKSLTGFTLDNQWVGNGSNLAGTIDFMTIGK